MEREAGGHFEAVEFVVFRCGEVCFPLLDDNVASGAGATAAAGVLDVKAKVFGEIKEAHRFSVATVRNLTKLEFVLGTIIQQGDLRHGRT